MPAVVNLTEKAGTANPTKKQAVAVAAALGDIARKANDRAARAVEVRPTL